MKKKNLLVYIVIAVVLVLIFANLLFLKNKIPSQTTEFDVIVEVAEVSLIILDENVSLPLNMGKIAPGMAFKKSINLSNTQTFPINTKTIITGEIADWANISVPNSIPPNSQALANLTITVPMDAAYGNYSVRVRFDFVKTD